MQMSAATLILISLNPSYQLADFGICYSTTSERLTEINEQLGSRHWQAPELLNGRLKEPTAYCDYFLERNPIEFYYTPESVHSVQTDACIYP